RHDIRGQHRGRGRAPEIPQEGLSAMTLQAPSLPASTAGPTPANRYARPRRARSAGSLLAHGLPMVWSNGGALVLAIGMIVGLLALVFYQGMSTFWPAPAVLVHTAGGKKYLGEVIRDDRFKPEATVFNALPPDQRETARAAVEAQKGFCVRRLF